MKTAERCKATTSRIYRRVLAETRLDETNLERSRLPTPMMGGYERKESVERGELAD
jgi:hypothetical protein